MGLGGRATCESCMSPIAKREAHSRTMERGAKWRCLSAAWYCSASRSSSQCMQKLTAPHAPFRRCCCELR